MADDEIDQRLSRRFNGDDQDDVDDEEDGNAGTSQRSQADMSSSTSGSDRNAQSSRNAQNIKEEWNVRSFYLDDDLDGDLTTAFKRLDLELDEADSDLSLKKTRHFYPLIVELGLERMESMDIEELTERLED